MAASPAPLPSRPPPPSPPPPGQPPSPPAPQPPSGPPPHPPSHAHDSGRLSTAVTLIVGLLAFIGAIVASYLGSAATARSDSEARLETKRSEVYSHFAGLAAEQLTVLDLLKDARARQDNSAIAPIVRGFGERESKMQAALVDLKLFASRTSFEQGQKMLAAFDNARQILVTLDGSNDPKGGAQPEANAQFKAITFKVLPASDACSRDLDDFALVVKHDLGVVD